MPEFMVALDHMTYYAVQAEDEVTAIDLVLEGQGLEIASETRDAYISEDERREPRRHGDLGTDRGGPPRGLSCAGGRRRDMPCWPVVLLHD